MTTQRRAAARPMPEGVRSVEAWQVARGLGRLDALRRAHQQAAHLGAADQRLLWLLSDGVGRTLRDIAEELGLEQSTVNRQVNAALRAGLLARSRDGGQASWLVSATDAGLASFQHDLDLNLGAFQAGLESLGVRDRTIFLRLLDRFVGAYDVAVHQSGDQPRP